MAENFAIAQGVMDRLERTRPFKFRYRHSPLKDISLGDIEEIISAYLEIKEQEEKVKIEKKDCCKPEDMRPYQGQKGQVSKATHFCRVCGQHWIFEKAAKPGEQEWFSATPATSALEKKDGS